MATKVDQIVSTLQKLYKKRLAARAFSYHNHEGSIGKAHPSLHDKANFAQSLSK